MTVVMAFLMAIKTAVFLRQQIFFIYYIYDSSCAPDLAQIVEY